MSLTKAQIAGALSTLTLLVGAAALPQIASAQTSTTQPVHNQMRRERHPELRAALRALENARDDLQKGARDFGGERVEALRDTNKAIAEVQQAIAKDRY